MNKNFQQTNFTSTSSISSGSKSSQIISNESLCSEQSSMSSYVTKNEQFDGIKSARSIEFSSGNLIAQDCSTVSLRDGSSMTIDECIPPILPVKIRNRSIRRERHISQYDNIDEHDCPTR